MIDEKPVGREEAIRAIMRMFGNHFVSLAIRYGPRGLKTSEKDCIRNYSGFIVSIRGVWNFCTAGHILREVEDAYNNGVIDIKEAQLVDSYGNAHKTEVPTPFDFVDAGKTYIYDDKEGLDFGFVALRPYYQVSLAANGILPISEETWENQPAECDRYFLMGLPFEVNPLEYDPNKLNVGQVLLGLEKINERPVEFPLTTHPRFYGQLRSAKMVEDIDGMSGGPIFGVARGEDGTCRYWVVAIQSGWYRPKRTIAACPLKAAGAIVEGFLRGFDAMEAKRRGWDRDAPIGSP